MSSPKGFLYLIPGNETIPNVNAFDYDQSTPLRLDEAPMEALKDAAGYYEVERRARHLERPGFRINELQLSPTQTVPRHYHNTIVDTIYVLEGNLRVYLQDPKESKDLGPSDSLVIAPKRPHLVTVSSETSATFLALQGLGEYDYVPVV